jgi:hypothetical protein
MAEPDEMVIWTFSSVLAELVEYKVLGVQTRTPHFRASERRSLP